MIATECKFCPRRKTLSTVNRQVMAGINRNGGFHLPVYVTNFCALSMSLLIKFSPILDK